jgi:GNAT superfamily N-acetyltransferase/anti-sigma regulatory factor (Ser/Thr protein kinase)
VREDPFIRTLTPALETRIERNPSLNLDTFIIPSPYVSDLDLQKDYEHSYVWEEEGELLGYFLVFASPDRSRLHLYRQITSPFGRGKGIGSAFLARLAREVQPDTTVYLYVWEKQLVTLDFFLNKGFAREGNIVYHNLIYHRLEARAGQLEPPAAEPDLRSDAKDLGRTRHDARKALRLLSDMVDNLSVGNCNRIIEDINRETTALINLLNSYRDLAQAYHEVDLRELLFERIVPYIEMSHVPCEVHLSLAPQIGAVYARYLEVGRALVNLVSNSLDAIKDAERPGVIRLSLAERDGVVELIVEDNGMGIEPERLAPGADGLPAFVGRSTKERKVGEGLGTRQVYAVFGASNIRVESDVGVRTRWTIRVPKRSARDDSPLRPLEERYRAFRELAVFPDLSVEHESARIASYIWQTTSLQTLCWDLIVPFGVHNNIRQIFRGILAYWHATAAADAGQEALRAELEGYRVEPQVVRDWLAETAGMVRRNLEQIAAHVPYDLYAGDLFRSYGQSVGATVIFTLDPTSGRFLAADRKLAEHVDFAPYLKRRREELLRGELTGDVNNTATPICLGVWSITGEKEALDKLALLREGCARLVGMGIPAAKRLSLYATTYRSGPVELNTYLPTTLGAVAGMADSELSGLLTAADEEEFFSGTAD